MEFYPDLVRRSDYSTRRDGQYYNYRSYRDEVTQDCKKRCVYCDITLEEHGGEGFHLDHFKPQNLFSDLINNPTNLVSACPHCNNFKSDNWPSKYPQVCFVDPFEPDRHLKFSISNSGHLSAAPDNQAAYQIQLLNLNRPARVQLRRKRKQIIILQLMLNEVKKEMLEISNQMENNNTNHSNKARLDLCIELVTGIQSLLF